MENVSYYGDNLDTLRCYVKEESVDFIYLAPPFNSNQNYNVLFKEQNVTRAASQIRALNGPSAIGCSSPSPSSPKPHSTTKTRGRSMRKPRSHKMPSVDSRGAVE
jgi:hypothetical protein